MKSKGSEIQEFGNLLDKSFNAKTKIQTHWVKVKSVDWNEKTMVAIGIEDNLEFYDVLLGLGSMYRKPKADCKCLIGIILNKEASTFLIDAQQIEALEFYDQTGFKIELNDGLMTINGNEFSGLVKAPELKTQIDKNTQLLSAIRDALVQWVPSPQDGGAALKALVASFSTYQTADLSDIENESIKHGNGN